MKKVLASLLALVVLVSALPLTASATTTPLGVVSNLIVLKSGSGAKVSWSSVTGATGYRVYRKVANSDSSYKAVKTTKEKSYTDTSIKKGKTYYYTVKAYKKSSSTTTWSKSCSGFSFSLDWTRITGPSTASRSKSTVNKQWVATNGLSTATKFEVNPSAKKPFEAGKLKQSSIDNTLSRLNYFRWLTGVPKVEFKSDYARTNQWGAVLLHNIGYVTHNVSKKPAGMTDAQFKKAQEGIACTAQSSTGRISGNCWTSSSVVKAINAFVDDGDSYSPGKISHRSGLLDPNCSKVSFGATSSYVTLSTFNGGSNTKDIYPFPAAGYFPTQSISDHSYWSIRFGKGVSASKPTVKLYYAGKAYNASDVHLSDWYWYSLVFKVPQSLKSEIVKSGAYKSGAIVTVKVNGLKSSNTSNGWACYRVRFFKAN